MISHLFETLTTALQSHSYLALGASFVWGILSVLLSPCHLASIPLVVAFIGQQKQMTTKRAFAISSFFSLGILLSIAIIGAPSNGALVVNGDGTVTYTHDGSNTVSDSFTYTIADITGSISNVASVNIVVNSVNDTPTTIGITDVTVSEDSSSTTIDLNVAFDDADNLDSELSYSIVGNSSNLEAAFSKQSNRLQHGASGLGRDGHLLHHDASRNFMSRGTAVRFEFSVEHVHRDFAPLEAGPATVGCGIGNHAVDGVRGDSELSLVLGNCMQGRSEHDAA